MSWNDDVFKSPREVLKTEIGYSNKGRIHTYIKYALSHMIYSSTSVKVGIGLLHVILTRLHASREGDRVSRFSTAIKRYEPLNEE